MLYHYRDANKSAIRFTGSRNKGCANHRQVLRHIGAPTKSGVGALTDDAQLIRKTIHMDAVGQKTEIELAGKKPIFSYNQTDFVKDRTAVEV